MSTREERLLELLCDASLGCLAPADEPEARTLRQEAGARAAWEEQALERAAVAIAVAGSLNPRESAPPRLFARIEQQALQAVTPAFAAGLHREPLPVSPGVASPRGPRRWQVAATWMAAAACLLLAIGSRFLWPREVIVTRTVVVPASTASGSEAPPAAPTPPLPKAEREALLAQKETEKAEWSPTKEAASANAAGDVVWNQAEQRGFMRFHGLARNDPSESQYQLWIFDKTRDARYPVDGGVFDIEAGSGDVIVPIHARIPVGAAVLFAVTVEKPGGVVVSKREHIVLTAKTRA